MTLARITNTARQLYRDDKGLFLSYIVRLPKLAMTKPARWLEARKRARGEARLFTERTRDETSVRIPLGPWQLEVPVSDEGLARQLIVYGEREPGCRALLERVRRRDLTILDVGANVGYYVLLEAPLAKHIYAIEPNPEAYAVLEQNVRNNGLPGITLFRRAISDTIGEVQFGLADKWNWSRIIDSPDAETDDIKQLVPTTMDTLNAMAERGEIPDRVDFIRMDVEGHEAQILAGADHLIERSPDCALLFEFHPSLMPRARRKQIAEFLRAHGFAVQAFFGAEDREPGKGHDIDDMERMVFGTWHIFATRGGPWEIAP